MSPYCDEFGGYVLNATLDMYAYCTIETSNDNSISFYAADRNEFFESKSCGKLELDGLLDLHKGIYNRIIKEFNQSVPLSFKMITYSDAPAGSGLGSSSTMVVAILQAFVEWMNLPLGEYDIAHLAYEIERIDVGLSGGRQDQYAATFGGFNFIEFYAEDRVIVNPLRIKSWVINELETSIVLYYTGASRESANIIKEQVKNAENKNEKSLQAMHELKADALIMKEAILKGELRKFAEYLGKSWEAKKRMASSISNSNIDRIYDLAMESGAYAGKVSGAGGGGFMIFMVDPVRRLSLIRELRKLDGEVINFHFTSVGTEGWKA
ncbi:GHMP kinase [Paenibacillus alginolyticus]|uniref:GHMP family kinase ATP-binding protein n=1 Tax=Paenibacillus alginolyticus TaxID=59839 RepID=UPI00040D8F8E|nr:GHMP kinase [Paenibacillus alginolyticus]MCY9664839.1 GHMP kinase [Paenibacillus alginolyticus]